MKKITIEQISFGLTYEGYYWLSDAKKPIVLNNKTVSKDIFAQLPFIIEGNFYSDADGGVSINIKNIDGQYLITQVSFKDLITENLSDVQEYLPHDLENQGIKKIKLVQYWHESEADDLLAGMKTLIPAWLAFKGFVKN